MGALIVDRDERVRRHLIGLTAGGMGVSDLEVGLLVASQSQPSVIFLGVRFDGPWRTGVDVIPEFRAASPDSLIVIISTLPNEYEEQRARELGAGAYFFVGDLVISGEVSEARPRRATEPQSHRRLALA